MIATSQPLRQAANAQYDQRFLEMLPAIERLAGAAFRSLQPQIREEALAAVVMDAFCAFRRLVEQGKQELAYASPLARFAVARYWAGRGAAMPSVQDILSPQARTAHGIVVERLDMLDPETRSWREALVEDRRATPAEIAAARIDVAAWLRSLSHRSRRIAESLALGTTTSEAARRFRVSSARVSQFRRELEASWRAFQGEARQEAVFAAQLDAAMRA